VEIKNKEQINKFFKKAKQSVSKKQEEMVEYAMDSLLLKSPLPLKEGSEYSRGEYASNHKIQINQGMISPHLRETGSASFSIMANRLEAAGAEKINCGDMVEIFNTTPYNVFVEFGGPTWQREGYYTYTLALAELKGKFGNVAK
jgi:hypothetical protein